MVPTPKKEKINKLAFPPTLLVGFYYSLFPFTLGLEYQTPAFGIVDRKLRVSGHLTAKKQKSTLIAEECHLEVKILVAAIYCLQERITASSLRHTLRLQKMFSPDSAANLNQHVSSPAGRSERTLSRWPP